MAICPNCKTAVEQPYTRCPSDDGFFAIEEAEHVSHPDDRLLGRRIGDRFIVASILGSGSMGYVYKAYQAQVDRMVALKVFHADKVEGTLMGQRSVGSSSPGGQDRFAQEARVLAKLSHPNCVTLYDFGVSEDERFLYIAMEHVAGVSLRKAVRRGLKIDAILEIVRQILMALREAHSLSIVHRDLKPENIILSYRRSSDEQIVKVLDFGIAKLLQQEVPSARTAVGLLFGTPAYMSPEQCRGESAIGPATDVYALGCMLYELVCGKLPYVSKSPQEMVRMHQLDPVPDLHPRMGLKVPPGLETFVRTCMAKLPEDRYPDAHAALIAFEALAGKDAGQALRVVSPEGAARKGRVSVPNNRISGSGVDPTVDRAAPEGLSVRMVSAQGQAATGGVTDTARGKIATGSGAPSFLTTLRQGQNAMVLIALTVVLIFCGLLFTYIYLSMRG